MRVTTCWAPRRGTGSSRSAAGSGTTPRRWRGASHPADRALTRTVLNAWCDRFPSGWIGRRLVPLFLQSGLRDVVTYPKTLVLRDLDVADQVFSFISTAERLAEARAIGRDDADRWGTELRTANAEEQFFTSYTGFLVCGTRRLASARPA